MRAIVNLRGEPRLREQFEYAQVVGNTVLIDRRSKWGNPFSIGKGRDREQAIARYREDLWRRIRAGEVSLQEFAELDGCWLACWCEPLPCHGDVLARAAAWALGTLEERTGARCLPPFPLHEGLPGAGTVSDAVPRGTAHGVRAGGEELASDVISYCATRAPSANPSGPPLRSGAGGSARRRDGATVAQAQPPLRPAKTRT